MSHPFTAPRPRLSRREWLKLAAAGVAGGSLSGWLETLAAGAAKDPRRRRSCVLLWMSGGPSQMDTFDLKPGHANGGPFKETATAVPGIRISEHLPKLAEHMGHLALVRSLTSKEGEHGLATYYAHGCATLTAATASARAACWPAAWSSGGSPSSRCRWAGPAASAGTRTSTTSRRCAS
jgi:hypothetical protein